MLKEVRFSFRHDQCWLQETTERFRGLTLIISSLYENEGDIHVDITLHGTDPAELAQIETFWDKDPRIRKVAKLFEGPRGVRYHVRYDGSRSIYPHILRHTPISLGAINIANGTEHYQIVGEAADVQALLLVMGARGDLKVKSVRDLAEMPDLPVESEGSFEAGFTDKQLDALLLAYAEGYYQWPRTISATELAARHSRSSSAYLSHLRQAEAKALEWVMQHIKAENPARWEAVRGRTTRQKE